MEYPITARPDPLPEPALLKSTWQTRKKPPSIHSHFSFSVIFPPGPIELGFTSPSSVQEPASMSSFLCSGPGLGALSCASAPTTKTTPAARMIPARFIAFSSRNFETGPYPVRIDVPHREVEAARPPGELILESRSPRAGFLPVSPMRCRGLMKLQFPHISLLHPHGTEMLISRRRPLILLRRFAHDRVVGNDRRTLADHHNFNIV